MSLIRPLKTGKNNFNILICHLNCKTIKVFCEGVQLKGVGIVHIYSQRHKFPKVRYNGKNTLKCKSNSSTVFYDYTVTKNYYLNKMLTL